MPHLPNYQFQSSNKRFDRKAVIIFTILAGLSGFIFFAVYRPLLVWNPVIPREIIEVRDTVYFDSNSSLVHPEIYPKLESIVKNHIGNIVVIGGADSSGSAFQNWYLSRDRATAIQQMIINMGVKADSVLAIGFGDRRPINRQNKAANRYTIIKWKKYQ